MLGDAYPDAVLSVCKSAREAKRICADKDIDIVIIIPPLSDEQGNRLAADICESTTSGCMVMTDSQASGELEEYGALVMPKQASPELFFKALRLIIATRRRMQGVAKENVKLQKELDEIKLINRAKLVLMQYLKFSENQAHRYIETQAMDLRMSRREIAMKVIKTYGLDA